MQFTSERHAAPSGEPEGRDTEKDSQSFSLALRS
jgi:hypothetical protein